jgi:CHASE2 domain-containing sensor protein
MTKGQALLIGLAVLGLGAAGYGAFAATGFEGFSAGIAASAVLMLVVVLWTGSYLFRALTGGMTYMQQRRTYRQAYDAYTDAELLKRFEALSPEEQARLLAETGAVVESDASIEKDRGSDPIGSQASEQQA